MKAVLSLALVAALALAGCASTTSDSESTSGSATTSKASGSAAGSSSGTKSGTSGTAATGTSGSPTTTPGSNAAPVITAFAANVTGLNVTFTLAASDANNDTLTYTLSFGDASANVTGTLPAANVTHAFAAAGNYTSRLVVSDGSRSVNRSAVVALAAVSGAGGAFTPIHQEGEVAILCVQCANPVEYNTCLGLRLEMSGIDCFFFEVPAAAAAAGRTAVVTSSNGFVNYDAMADCSGSGDGTGSFIDETGSSPYSFVIPDGTGCLLFYEYADIPPSYVVDIV